MQSPLSASSRMTSAWAKKAWWLTGTPWLTKLGEPMPIGATFKWKRLRARSSARAMKSGERPLFSAVFWMMVRS